MFGIVICLALVGDVSATDQPSQVVTRDDVEALARQYRIQIYNLYRTQRSTFDERTEVANEVLQLARRVRRDADSQLLIAGWFEQAKSAASTKAPLPPVPEVDESEFEKLAVNRPASKRSSTSNENSELEALVNEQTATQQTSFEATDLTSSPEPEQSGGLLKAIGGLFSGATASDSSTTPTTDTPPISTDVDSFATEAADAAESADSAELDFEDFED